MTLAGLLLPADAVRAATTCPNPNAIGVGREIVLDTTAGQLYGNLQYEANADLLQDKEVVLTFDDGPYPRTTQPILDALDAECTKATFFVVGRMALAHPEMLREVDRRGHTIGGHTYDHGFMGRASPPSARTSIERGNSMIAAMLGKPPAPFFRFPYLDDPRAIIDYAKARNFGIFSIDVDSYDTSSAYVSKERIIRQSVQGLINRGKGILLMHDIKPRTAEALPEILRQLKANGFKVVHLRSKHPLVTDSTTDAEARLLIERLQTTNLASRGGTEGAQQARQLVAALSRLPEAHALDAAVQVAALAPAAALDAAHRVTARATEVARNRRQISAVLAKAEAKQQLEQVAALQRVRPDRPGIGGAGPTVTVAAVPPARLAGPLPPRELGPVAGLTVGQGALAARAAETTRQAVAAAPAALRQAATPLPSAERVALAERAMQSAVTPSPAGNAADAAGISSTALPAVADAAKAGQLPAAARGATRASAAQPGALAARTTAQARQASQAARTSAGPGLLAAGEGTARSARALTVARAAPGTGGEPKLGLLARLERAATLQRRTLVQAPSHSPLPLTHERPQEPLAAHRPAGTAAAASQPVAQLGRHAPSGSLASLARPSRAVGDGGGSGPLKAGEASRLAAAAQARAVEAERLERIRQEQAEAKRRAALTAGREEDDRQQRQEQYRRAAEQEASLAEARRAQLGTPGAKSALSKSALRQPGLPVVAYLNPRLGRAAAIFQKIQC